MLFWDDDNMIQFVGSLLSFKTIHSGLVYRSQDHDNGSIVSNYLRDVAEMLLVSTRIYLILLEQCSLVLGQIIGLVNILVCSILALVLSHLLFVSAPKAVQDAILNNCNRLCFY